MKDAKIFVGAVVERHKDILLVRQSPGHPLAGRWTVPWGAIEPGESPLSAALREIWEEGGIRAEAVGLLGVQELPSPQAGSIALVYLCRHVSGTPQPHDRETDAARYFSLSALDALDDPVEPWSNWLVRRIYARRFTVTYADATNPLRQRGAFI